MAKRHRGRGAESNAEVSPSSQIDRYFSQASARKSRNSQAAQTLSKEWNRLEQCCDADQTVSSHQRELRLLRSAYTGLYPQWAAELTAGFNLCFFGCGSKRDFLLDLAQHLACARPSDRILVVDGRSQDLTTRSILTMLSSSASVLCGSKIEPNFPSSDPIDAILQNLSRVRAGQRLVLLIHSIDSSVLGRLSNQRLLARLATSPSIRIVASADSLSFSLLWDSSAMKDLKWLFHDCTTLVPNAEETGANSWGTVLDEFKQLLGKTGGRLHGVGGVIYILQSLTQNARDLFRLLVLELLELSKSEPRAAATADRRGESPEDGVQRHSDLRSIKSAAHDRHGPAVESRKLYQKAISQFIATNETSFRMLLKEFHDHEMISSHVDKVGAELLSVPFVQEELDLILSGL